MWGATLLAGPAVVRKFSIGSTVVAGQIVCHSGSGGYGVVGDPTSVNDFTEAVGVALESGTYAASSPGVHVTVSCSPFMTVAGKVSGGTAADTAFTSAQILTQGTASTTVLTDSNVGTLDYTGGVLIPLTGSAAGDIRVITAQTDNTSTAVTVPFSASIAVGDTALRLHGIGNQPVAELTTDFCQWNNLLTTNEALYTTSLGSGIMYEIYVDDQAISGVNKVSIKSSSAPRVVYEIIFSDHLFNSLE